MNEQHDHYRDELDQLMEQVDALLSASAPDSGAPQTPDFDPDDYTPADARIEEPMVYQNYSNRYGRPEPIPQTMDFPPYEPVNHILPEELLPTEDPEPEKQSIASRHSKSKKRRRRKPRGCCIGCLGMLLLPVVLAAVLIAGVLGLSGPRADGQLLSRKPDTSTILLVGTDAEGERTDTMMLLYLSGSEQRVGLLSLPRDTYTITSSGRGAKLNSAYIRNGMGEEGMEGLLDYIQDIIGYRPDGYLMVSMDIVPQIVDAMGGLTVEVPMSFELEGVTLEEGTQHLGGIEVLQLLRYRKGYAMQDLGRIEVQRMVIGAAMEQWISPKQIGNALEALTLVQENCMTDLELTEIAWAAKAILQGRDQIQSHTLPGWAGYIGDVSYYILDREDVARLINESYNPFTTEITVDQLNIAG